jgi:hypothetical protein
MSLSKSRVDAVVESELPMVAETIQAQVSVAPTSLKTNRNTAKRYKLH